MVSRGLSGAASLLLLAMGSTAFVPTKLGAGVRTSLNTPVENKLESCDAVLSRMEGKVCDFNQHANFILFWFGY